MELSVIIVNWNATDALKKCLDSIRDNVDGIKYEIIAADNNSKDINHLEIKQIYPEVHFIFNESNKGYSKANNQCTKEAKGEFLLFLNPDIILVKNSAKSMIDFLKTEKNAGAVGGKFLEADGSLQRFYRRFPTLIYMISYATIIAKIFPENRYAKFYEYHDKDFETITKVDQPGTSLFMIKHSLFDELNGFNETMPIFFNDADLCKRIYQKGFDIYVLPDAKAFHLKGESIKKEKPEVIILEGALSLIEYFKVHKSVLYAILAKIVILLDQFLRLLYGLIMNFLGKKTKDEYFYRLKVIIFFLFNKRIVLYR
jgi:GT2 family glycosyltransferase